MLSVGDGISILKTPFGCWCLTLKINDRGCWWQKGQNYHQLLNTFRQHISFPTFVTNIDVDRSLDPFASLMQHHPYGLTVQMKTVYPNILYDWHLSILESFNGSIQPVHKSNKLELLNFVVPTKHITRKTFYDNKNVCSSLSIGWFCSKTCLSHEKWYIFLERNSKARLNAIFYYIWTCSINFCTFN